MHFCSNIGLAFETLKLHPDPFETRKTQESYMLTTVLTALATLLVGGAAGFVLGRRSQRVDLGQPVTETPDPRGSLTDELVGDEPRLPRQRLATTTDETHEFAPVDRPAPAFPAVPEAVNTGIVTFKADYTGDVFVALSRPADVIATEVEVEVIWGGYRGTATILVGAVPVAVKFGKDQVDTEDAVVTINTSEPTVRAASEGFVLAGVEVHTLDWK